ncbi:EAL domain-containing protein [Paractinoplanes tereljensis]|uniref:EAL domain-containing protein n=1 Tax=Paractinoplanes tereljensis TaxID=571912 RepID=UPI0019455708|nr:EAL domain-containing protein [Actinoplanes tereljensis]
MIIGVDGVGVRSSMSPLRYAERDAVAVHDALGDTYEIVLFSGSRVRAAEIKRTLRRIALESDESDVLLVYYAGQVVEPSWSRGSEFYLVTPDLDESALSERPDAGLRMTFLNRDVLPHFRGTAVAILDCCRADGSATFQGTDLVDAGGRDDPRHGVLVACAPDAATREDATVQHGVFTHHVLEALRDGASVETLSGLDPRHAGAHQVSIIPLGNPLDRHAPELTRLIRRLARTGPMVGHVERVRSALGAGGVAYLGSGEDGYVAVDATDGFDLDAVRHLLRAARPRGFGHTVREGPRRLWCAPLGPASSTARLLAVVDPPEWLVELGQTGAKVLETIWHTTTADSPEESELHFLSALRSVFGRLPDQMFERALDLYREVLESFRIVFQPVVTIGEAWTQVGVHSYEALARRSLDDQRAPVAMLQLAHTWGDHFVVERDRSILGRALTAYKLAHADSPWSADEPKPVSVNVSVRSLLDDSYVDTLRQLISELELDAGAVTLEISEQDAIEPWAGEQWGEAPHDYFNKRLAAIAQDVGVAFSLDDFGVGHASLARMVDLRLTHIKVDRAILQHELATRELELVVAVARQTMDAPRAVVVEGVDEESLVSLRQIYRSGIRHVQGYITGERGAPELRPLAAEVRKEIAARVRGDDETRPTSIRPALRKSA